MTDWELLQRYVSSRDEAAFAALVDRHLGLVYNAARRQLAGVCDLAEDVTQSVFLLLAQKGSTIPQRQPLAAWLHQAVRYVCNNVRKTETRRRRREGEVAVHPQAAAVGVSEVQPILPLLDEGVARLGEKERSAIVLRYLENQSTAAAAMAMGISTDAVEKRVERGLSRLRDFFARRGLSVAIATVTSVLAGESAKSAPSLLRPAVIQTALHGASAPGVAELCDRAAQMLRRSLLVPVLLACLAIAIAIGLIVEIYRAGPTVDAIRASVIAPSTAPSSRPAPVNQPRGTYYADPGRNVFTGGSLASLDDKGRPKGWTDVAAFDTNYASISDGLVRLETRDATQTVHVGTIIPLQPQWTVIAVSARVWGPNWRTDGSPGAEGGVRFTLLDADGHPLGKGVRLFPAGTTTTFLKIKMGTLTIPAGAKSLAMSVELVHTEGQLAANRFLVVPIDPDVEAPPSEVVALHSAMKAGDAQTVRKMILADRRLLECRNMDYDAGTPLVGSAWDGKAEVTKALLALGADRRARDGNQQAEALDWAAFYGRPTVVQALVDAGEDPTRLCGGTPTQWAKTGRQWGYKGRTPKDYQACIDILAKAIAARAAATRPG